MTKTKPSPKRNRVLVSLRIPAEVHDKIEAQAKRWRVSVREAVAHILASAVS